jgi:hypothetical protein
MAAGPEVADIFHRHGRTISSNTRRSSRACRTQGHERDRDVPDRSTGRAGPAMPGLRGDPSIIPAATGVARSAGGKRAVTGLQRDRPTFCRLAISTSCSLCRKRLRRSSSRTRRRSMRSCSAPSPRSCTGLPPIQDIWVPRSASSRCCTPGARTSTITRISIASCRAGDYRPTSPDGSPSGHNPLRQRAAK